MSEYVVKLPDVGEGIAEAEIVEWHVNVGDTITEDQVMVEVMTDKATVELPSPVAGVVMSIGAAVGDIVAVGSPLIRIETNGGGAPARPNRRRPSAAPTAPARRNRAVEAAARAARCRRQRQPTAAAAATPAAGAAVTAGARDQAPTAAPAVRRRATALGIDLADGRRHRPGGRIVHDDLDAPTRHARQRRGCGPTVTAAQR